MLSNNGFKNRPTWLAYLWLGCDVAAHRHWSERARLHDQYWKVTGCNQWQRRIEARRTLAGELRSELTKGNPLGGRDLYTDLLTSAVEAIDFEEIARIWIDFVQDD